MEARVIEGKSTQIGRPVSLAEAFAQVAAKREADVIRFRTCCADPRASK